jgi:hypothetical protein
MTKSVGHLAAERERLEREIEALSRGLPDEAAAIVQKADDLLAAHGAKIAALKAKRDEIDSAFGVRARAAAEAEARARQEQYDRLVGELRQAENARCASVDKIEHHVRGLHTAIREANTSAGEVRALALELAALGGIERPSIPRTNQSDFVSRLGLRVSGIMTTLGSAGRLGSITWGTAHSAYPAAATGWGQMERAHFAPDLDALIAEVRPDVE